MHVSRGSEKLLPKRKEKTGHGKTKDRMLTLQLQHAVARRGPLNDLKILLYAPSNNAVDELILRLMQHGIWNFLGQIEKRDKIRIVRIGASSGESVRTQSFASTTLSCPGTERK